MSLKSIEDLKKFISGAPIEEVKLEKKVEPVIVEAVKPPEPVIIVEKAVKEEKPVIDIQPFMEKSTAVLEVLNRNLETMETHSNEALKGIVTSLEDLNKSLEAKAKKTEDLEKSMSDIMKRLEGLEKTPNVKKASVVEKNFEGSNSNEKKMSKSEASAILMAAAIKGDISAADINKFELSGNPELLSDKAKALLTQ